MSKISEHSFKKVRKVIDGVTIYNIDRDLENKLFVQFVKAFINSYNQKTKKFEANITDRELMLAYLPQLTDLEFDITDETAIFKILDNPDDTLEDVMDEIKVPIMKILKRAGKYVYENIRDILDITDGMTEQQKDNYFKELAKLNTPKVEEIEEKPIAPTDDELKEFRQWKSQQLKVGE